MQWIPFICLSLDHRRRVSIAMQFNIPMVQEMGEYSIPGHNGGSHARLRRHLIVYATCYVSVVCIILDIFEFQRRVTADAFSSCS